MTKFCHVAVIMWVGLQCVIVAVPGRTHLLFKLTFFYTVLENGAAKTTELSLMMTTVICMSSKSIPDYESDTHRNKQIAVIN